MATRHFYKQTTLLFLSCMHTKRNPLHKIKLPKTYAHKVLLFLASYDFIVKKKKKKSHFCMSFFFFLHRKAPRINCSYKRNRWI